MKGRLSRLACLLIATIITSSMWFSMRSSCAVSVVLSTSCCCCSGAVTSAVLIALVTVIISCTSSRRRRRRGKEVVGKCLCYKPLCSSQCLVQDLDIVVGDVLGEYIGIICTYECNKDDKYYNCIYILQICIVILCTIYCTPHYVYNIIRIYYT